MPIVIVDPKTSPDNPDNLSLSAPALHLVVILDPDSLKPIDSFKLDKTEYSIIRNDKVYYYHGTSDGIAYYSINVPEIIMEY